VTKGVLLSLPSLNPDPQAIFRIGLAKQRTLETPDPSVKLVKVLLQVNHRQAARGLLRVQREWTVILSSNASPLQCR